jgi:hypothetical protein
VYERLERLVQLPALRVCAPFLLGGGLMLLALANDPVQALQAGGLVSLLACIVLVREAGYADATSADATTDRSASGLADHLYAAALHASLFAASFFLASLGMGVSGA